MLLLLLAGALCGLAAVLFHELVELMRKLLIGAALRQHGVTRVLLVIAVPAVVALLIALVLKRWAPHAGGANLARVRRAYEEDPSILRDRSILATLILTPISLGSGAPLGPEGPTVVIASGVAMWLARLAKLPRKMVRGMIPVGTAAGIAAIFNTPITGVVFAMEEVMGSASRGVLGGTIVAAVAAAVVERLLLGGRPLLSAPSGTWTDVRELVGFVLAGAVAGIVSGSAISAVVKLRNAFRAAMPSLAARAVLGGALIGGIGLLVPAILGVGYDTTSIFLHGGGDVRVASASFIAKVAGFVVALASGIIGGTFAPSLFIGAALGSAVGHGAAMVFPHAPIDPGAYALVGMGAFFGGLLRCPISAVLIVFEVTGDYGLILPLMLAVGVSTSLSRLIAPHSLTELQMAEEGYVEPVAADDPLATLAVSDVMSCQPISIAADTTMLDAARRMTGSRHRFYPVIDGEGKLTGMLPSAAIDSAAREGDLDPPITAHVQQAVVIARGDDDILEVIRRMAAAAVQRCPVVDGDGKLIGFLSPADVLRARMTRLEES